MIAKETELETTQERIAQYQRSPRCHSQDCSSRGIRRAKTLKIPYPEDLPQALEKTPEEFERELRFLVAAKLYEMGSISSGRAAELAGMDRVEQCVEKLSEQAGQKDLRGKAREKSTSGGVLMWYVGARRLSATKHMSLFHQPVNS